MTDDLIQELRRVGVKEVDISRRRRAEYASDASNYRVIPAAVVFPRHSDEVAAVLSVCRELDVPFTARGGGTSVAGNAIGSGVVVDFSRHLHQVGRVDPERRTVFVEPGAVLDAVTAAAAPHGLRFGPDPSTHARATVGGSLANNACGARALGYGRTSDNVATIEVMTVDGIRFTAGTVGASPEPIRSGLTSIVAGRHDLIRSEFGTFSRQASGFALEHLLVGDASDLARFLVGTEGTLAVTLGATLRLTFQPAATALVVLGYTDLPTAAEAVPILLTHRPTALEGLDNRLVKALKGAGRAQGYPDLPPGGGWLFAETAGETPAEAADRAQRLAYESECIESMVFTGGQAQALWRLREDGAGLSGRSPRQRPAWPGWEDAAVPPNRLPEYLRAFAGLMREHDLDGMLFGHFGDGCIHTRIDFPLSAHPGAYREFAQGAAKLVREFGGSLSGEHGDGRARGELLSTMYSRDAIKLMAAVKQVFDPAGILNPGIIVDPVPIDSDLRVPSARSLKIGMGFALTADGGDLSTAVHRCVGIGRCRSLAAETDSVMCPSFVATRDEKDSTRGRARVLQELANGSLVDGFASEELAQSLDLCLSCKGCSSDCPAGVDMATYKAEALHQRYRHRLRPRSHYALGWLPRWARVASRLPKVTNRLLANSAVVNAARWSGGIDQRRALPQFSEMTFRRWFLNRPDATHSIGSRPTVMFWIDTFTDNFTPDVGRATVEVLEDAGYRVDIPDRGSCCGLTWISTGQLDSAKRQLRRTLDALEPSLRNGTPIVAVEPSCAAVLRSDAAELLPHDWRAATARTAVRTLAEILSDTPEWTRPDLTSVRGIAQPHCHHHAVLGWETDEKLLHSMGATVERVGGCCGLAGNFGVERGHYDISVAVAESALLPAVRATSTGDVLLADGFSCRTQIDQLAGRHSLHLAQLLARSIRVRKS